MAREPGLHGRHMEKRLKHRGAGQTPAPFSREGKMEKKEYHLRLTEEIWRQVRLIAAQEMKRYNQVVEEAIREYIKRKEEKNETHK